jgi:hypothetical protein
METVIKPTSFWIGKIHRNASRHTNFVQLQIGITSDNSSRREINRLPIKLPCNNFSNSEMTCTGALSCSHVLTLVEALIMLPCL